MVFNQRVHHQSMLKFPDMRTACSLGISFRKNLIDRLIQIFDIAPVHGNSESCRSDAFGTGVDDMPGVFLERVEINIQDHVSVADNRQAIQMVFFCERFRQHILQLF